MLAAKDLANLYRVKVDYIKAEQYYQKALEISCTTVGENHQDYVQSLR